MGLREIYEAGAPESYMTKCGLCEWLDTLPADEREFADKILAERKPGKPEQYRFGAEPAGAMLQRAGCPVGHNIVGKHRRQNHGVTS